MADDGQERGEQGAGVIGVIPLMALSLFLLVGFLNLAVDGVVMMASHSAVDQGVRAGARQDAAAESACEDRARQVLANVLSGPAGSGAVVSCASDGETVTGRVHLELPAWIPLMGDATVDVTGQARREGLRP